MNQYLLICSLFLLSSAVVLADEKQSTAKKQNSETETDWLESYYQKPAPDEFVGKMKGWAKDGTLRNFDAQPALIAFTSQLMRQNRDQIFKWGNELSKLDPKDLVVFNTALVFSRTGEADMLIGIALGEKYNEFKRPPKILEIPLSEPPALNMVWGYWYATGSEKAVRRIIEGFRYEEAPEPPEEVKVPEGYKPYYKDIPKLTFISLRSNLIKHPRLQEICEKIYQEDKTLREVEKTNLYDVLSVWNREKYPIREELKKEQEKQ